MIQLQDREHASQRFPGMSLNLEGQWVMSILTFSALTSDAVAVYLSLQATPEENSSGKYQNNPYFI